MHRCKPQPGPCTQGFGHAPMPTGQVHANLCSANAAHGKMPKCTHVGPQLETQVSCTGANTATHAVVAHSSMAGPIQLWCSGTHMAGFSIAPLAGLVARGALAGGPGVGHWAFGSAPLLQGLDQIFPGAGLRPWPLLEGLKCNTIAACQLTLRQRATCMVHRRTVILKTSRTLCGINLGCTTCH